MQTLRYPSAIFLYGFMVLELALFALSLFPQWASLFTPGLLAALLAGAVACLRRGANHSQYQHLTVIETVLTGAEPLCQSAPELRAGMHIADLHLEPEKDAATPLTRMRHGCAALYELAQACETGKFAGVEYFAGESRLIDSGFKMLGFAVYPQQARGVSRLLAAVGGAFTALHLGRYEVHRRAQTQVGVISRKELLAHKEMYRRMSRLA